MKKFVLIIFVNIFLLIFVYFFTNFIINMQLLAVDNSKADYKYIKEHWEDFENYPKDYKRLTASEEILDKFCGEERVEFGEKYKNNPIIFLGDSYCYGHGLKKQESFPFLISEKNQRPVYSFCFCGSNLIDSLIFLNKQILKIQY